MDAAKLGRFIAETRKARGMTQAQLGARLYVTDKTVSKWERGAGFPDIRTLEPLAEALEVSLVDLMRGERTETESIPVETAEAMLTETLALTRERRPVEYLLGWGRAVFLVCLTTAYPTPTGVFLAPPRAGELAQGAKRPVTERAKSWRRSA